MAKRTTILWFPQRAVMMVGLLTLLVGPLIGCGSKEVVQVRGRVHTPDGSPIPGAVRYIRFEPTPDSNATIRKAASSEIAEDGTFTLFTRKPGDGVYIGKYAVTFTVLTKPLGGESLIKPEYTSADTTPFVVEVTDDLANLEYEIELK